MFVLADLPMFAADVVYVKRETGEASCHPITSDGETLPQPYNISWTVHFPRADGTEEIVEHNNSRFEVSVSGEVLKFHNFNSPAQFECVVVNEVGNATQRTILLYRQHLAVCIEGEENMKKIKIALKVSMQNT